MNESVAVLDEARFGYGRDERVCASLAIEPGEVVAILGPNGAGKSTLLKGMLGLCDHLGGEVKWFGSPGGGRGVMRKIGYVPQRSLAVSPVPSTVAELVDSGRVAGCGIFGRRRAVDRDAVSSAIAAVGLSDCSRQRVASLSGGQQRRALVARGLAGGASVLFLDEPLAGVDAQSQRGLATTLASLSEQGVTLVIVLHEPGPLAGLITRTIEIDEGHIVYDGLPRWADSVSPLGDGDHCDPSPQQTALGALFPNPL